MKPNWKTLFLLTTCCTLGLITSVRAQVSSDGTLSTTVSNPDNLNFTINNGNRVGGNLFHSFREFSVPNGGSAVFQNPLDVQNIISRVTGGSLSQINGLIQAQGSANLFLLNPAGISFGQNARLSIGGSFFATTADSLLFGDGIEFSATNPQAPLLTVNIPIGLRFRDNPGNITNQSVVQDNTGFGIGLQVNPGNSLALVGGNVSLEQGGRLTAAGGRIELGGLTGAGTVGLDTTGNTFRLNFPTNGLSNVSLADDARVAVRSNGGGDIAVNANIFTATNGGRLVGGIEGVATRKGGDITVNSNEFNISGVGQSRSGAGIYQQVIDNASGNAGDITINARTVSFIDGAQISSSTSGRGNAGNVTLRAENGDISLAGSFIFSNVLSEAQNAQAGNITIKAGSFSLLGGAELQSGIFEGGQGNGGNVTIDVPTGIVRIAGRNSNGSRSGIFNDVESGARGNGGNIFINAGSIFTDGAELTTTNAGTGSAGDISIQAGNAIALTNGSVINSSISGIGNAGNISLKVGDAIALADSSFITTNVQQGGSGKGGDIDIRGRSLTLTGGSQIQAGLFRRVGDIPGGIGTGGSIKINASDFVDISGFSSSNRRSGIFTPAETGSTGSGGSIDITTGAFRLTNFGIVNAEIDNGNNGGDITINAKTFEATNGRVQTILSGQAEAGRLFSAGDIQLNVTDSVSLKDGSLINSSTSGQGNAGNISLKVGDAIALADSSFIITNVQQGGSGKGGDIDIRGRSLTLTGGSQIQAGLFRRVGDIPGGIGTGGSIKINASDFVDISGFSSSNRRSGIFTPAETGSTGSGGSIDITTGAFRLTNFGIVNAEIDNGNNGGDITINAKTFEATNGRVQTILSGQAEAGRLFSAGDIQLNVTDSVSLKDGSLINSSTSGQGNAGNISLKVGDAIALADSSFITTNVQQGGSGKGGDIDIRGRSLTLTGGSQIQAGLFRRVGDIPGGIGTGGSIKINASDFVDISGFNPVSQLQSGIFTPAETGSTGPGGSIDITTGAFRLTNFGVVTAGTANGNNGGNITINAKTFEATNGLVQTILSGRSETYGLFSAGDIKFNVTDSVSLKDGSQINSSTFGRGNAGNISLKVGDAIALSNSSQIRNVVEPGGEGIGGDVDIRARSLTLTGGSQIQTSLFRELNGLSGGKGRAGNIEINATDFVNIFGVGTTGFSSGLLASAETGTTAISPQAAGNINLTTGNFRIADGAVVDALTYNSGDAGNITINANTFTASGGGQVITTAFNSGSAGNINLNVRDRITISGSDPNYNQRIKGTFDNQGAASGIFANTASGSTGKGGNITIQPLQNSFPKIAIADGGEVRVDSQGQGRGGEISITGNTLTLDRGIINASTASSNGGNINLRLRNFVRLQNESLISADARGEGGGNGGNITIDTPFIVAFPQNNDIIANAVSGNGGRVTTNATLFGIIPRTRADLEKLGVPGLNPRNLSTSDITAFSEQNSSFGDNVQVTSPDVDPSRGLVELPETVTDPTQKIAQNPCQQGVGNEFTITGRGGLPTTPNETLNSDNVRIDLLQPVASSGNSRSATKTKPATTVTATRVPAQGWIFNDKGQVVLTAYDPTNTGSQRSFRTAAACPAR